MTTHNLAMARRFADDILLIHEGRLVEHGPAAAFFARPATPVGRAFIDGELS
jgi:tungstate transport system ATP-binding protein